MFTVVRYVVAGVAMLAAVGIVIGNWACAIATANNTRKGIDRHHSVVPVLSALLTCLAYFVLPTSKKALIFIVPLIDLGTWVLVLLPITLLVEAWKRLRRGN